MSDASAKGDPVASAGAVGFTVEIPPDPLHGASDPEDSLGNAAVSGSLWAVAQVVVVKVASLAGTFALIHLLSPEDYGLAALAMSVQTMLVLMQPFTLGDVLLSSPATLARISGTAQRLGLVVSVFFAIATIVAGPWAANHYRNSALVLACAWVALRPLAEWTMVLPLARLRAQLRFRTISSVDILCLTGTTLASVLMAWLRFGWLSILLPQIAFVAVRGWLYWQASPAPPSSAWLKDEVRPLLAKYVLSGLGQYVHGGLTGLTPLVVGSFTGQREVGWYTLAFTLSIQVTTLTGFSIGQVLQPIFVKMSHDVARQSAAFLRACRVVAILAMPMFLVQAVTIPAAFRLFLPEKWAGAILMTQILSVGQAFFICVNPALGLLKAQGRFGTFMWWQTIQLVLVTAGMLAVGSSWRDAPLLPIVLMGGLYHVVSSPIGVWLSVRGRGATFRDCLDVFLRPFTIAALSVLPVGWALSRLPAGKIEDVLQLVLIPTFSLALFVSLVRRFDPSAARDCAHLLQGALSRIRSRTRAASSGPRR